MGKSKLLFYTVLFLFLFILPTHGEITPTFQSPTDSSKTKGCDGVATSEFGEKRGNKVHEGIDISGLSEGWSIKASADGEVIFSDFGKPGSASVAKTKRSVKECE